MSQSPSQPPKERVNIVYRQGTGDAQSEVELPLKMLVVGDLSGQDDATPIEERKPQKIDKNNFDAVMRTFDLKVDINIDGPRPEGAPKSSGPKDAPVSAHLKFCCLKDFEPDALCQQVEPLRRLLRLREALCALRGPMGNVPAFRKTIEALLGDDSKRAALVDEINHHFRAANDNTNS